MIEVYIINDNDYSTLTSRPFLLPDLKTGNSDSVQSVVINLDWNQEHYKDNHGCDVNTPYHNPNIFGMVLNCTQHV